MGGLPAIYRWPFVAGFFVTCTVPVWGQTIGVQTNEGPKISSSAPDGLRASSQEVREAQRGLAWRERLINLAITGRITKEEFESLVNRLQGN